MGPHGVDKEHLEPMVSSQTQIFPHENIATYWDEPHFEVSWRLKGHVIDFISFVSLISYVKIYIYIQNVYIEIYNVIGRNKHII